MLAPLDSISAVLSARRRPPLLRAVRRNLRAISSDSLAAPLVVGCSGGPDSTALVLALCALREELGISVHVVAIDHQLRPSSAGEAEMVVELAGKLGASAEVIAVQVGAGASRMAHSREARYAALAQAAQRQGARFVLVGHNRDDQAETVLMRLLGGAGLSGLSAMALVSPFPTGNSALRIARPLLSVPRQMIEAFLAPLSPLIAPLPFRDPTNGDGRYLRTRLRDEALPLLRRIAPHLDEHLLHLTDQLRADAEHLDDEAEQALLRIAPLCADGALQLSVAQLAALTRALRSRVLRLAAQRHLEIALGQRHLEALCALCARASQHGALDLPNLRAERRRDVLILQRRN